jgi:glycine cleavage system H protein
MMKIISGLKYSKEHEWVKVNEDKAYVGITDYAQHSLGGIVFVELPEAGTEFNQGDVIGVVESVKAASDIYSPLSGKVVEINGELADDPSKLNNKPYESWIAVLEIYDASQLDELMDEAEYEKFCAEEE